MRISKVNNFNRILFFNNLNNVINTMQFDSLQQRYPSYGHKYRNAFSRYRCRVYHVGDRGPTWRSYLCFLITEREGDRAADLYLLSFGKTISGFKACVPPYIRRYNRCEFLYGVQFQMLVGSPSEYENGHLCRTHFALSPTPAPTSL